MLAAWPWIEEVQNTQSQHWRALKRYHKHIQTMVIQSKHENHLQTAIQKHVYVNHVEGWISYQNLDVSVIRVFDA